MSKAIPKPFFNFGGLEIVEPKEQGTLFVQTQGEMRILGPEAQTSEKSEYY
jgi:hypothetical protein